MKTLSRDEVRTLRGLMTKLAETGAQPTSPKDGAYLFMQRGIPMSLSREQSQLLGECRRIVEPKRERPGTWGPKALSDVLHDAVLDLFDQPSTPARQRARAVVDRLENRLKRPSRTWAIVLPVDGIRIGAALRIGPVRFMKPKTAARQRWATSEVRADIKKEDVATAWAELKVEAVDDDGARRLGRYQLQLVLDAINFYAGRLKAPRDAAAHLPGVRALRWITPFVRAEGTPSDRFVHGHEAIGAWPSDLKPLHRFHGWRNLLPLLSLNTSLTRAQERMLAALRWIGRGAASPWPEQAFLDYVVALEALLLGNSKVGGSSYRLKLRGAHLLAVRREYQPRVFDGVSQLYRLRNDVVHSGSFEVDAHMRDTARTYATLSLLNLLRDPRFSKLDSEREIEAWFDRDFMPEG